MKSSDRVSLVRVLIAGGGYAGLQTAIVLERLMRGKRECEIILVDKREYHTLLPSLPEIISKRGFSIIYYKDILKNRHIEFIHAAIKDIRLNEKTALVVNDPTYTKSLEYDFLVLSLGSRPSIPNILGMNKYAYFFNTIEDAQLIATALQNMEGEKIVVIGGAGATGVELAGEIATLQSIKPQSSSKKVVLISTSLLNGFPNEAIKWAKIYLDSLGVLLLVGSEYSIVEIRPHSVRLKNGSEIKNALFIWTGGVVATPFLKQIGLKIGEKGRVLVNNYLQPEGRNDVFVIGDSALILDNLGHSLPTNAYFAKEHGKVAAYNIYAKINGLPLRKFSPTDPASTYAISIGSEFAISRISGLDLFGHSASNLKKVIKLKYLNEIGGVSLAGKEYSRF
ncbi:MAG TPA: FAD-dependent oxidoreductase [Nitrososphaeraceae archaeon]